MNAHDVVVICIIEAAGKASKDGYDRVTSRLVEPCHGVRIVREDYSVQYGIHIPLSQHY